MAVDPSNMDAVAYLPTPEARVVILLQEGKGGGHWRVGMAKNLAELRVIPTPANEYDESWKKERILERRLKKNVTRF